MISIIIPTLNEESILGKMLASLKAFTAMDHEVIVSDGHSTDRTVTIAKTYADKVVEYRGKTRQHIAEGKNAGAAAAKGDILLFLDADVFIPNANSFFKKTVGLFGDDSELMGLTVPLKVLPEYVRWSDKVIFGISNLIIYLLNNVFHSGASPGEFQMIRAAAFKRLGGYNPAYIIGEDQDMFARLARLGHTRMETSLYVLHTSRRAHAVGWPKLIWLWIAEFFYAKIKRRSYTKEWSVIR